MNADERLLVDAAVEIIAVGGNGEGWTLNDALDCLRIALCEGTSLGRWTKAVDRDHLAHIVGEAAYYIGDTP